LLHCCVLLAAQLAIAPLAPARCHAEKSRLAVVGMTAVNLSKKLLNQGLASASKSHPLQLLLENCQELQETSSIFQNLLTSLPNRNQAVPASIRDHD